MIEKSVIVDNRNRIIEEAAKLFRSYGIRSVTMDLLATNLGISKRTIYEVFKDKDELLSGVLQWMASRQKERMNSILEESENVIVANFRMIEMMKDHFQNMSPAFQLDMKKYHHSVINDTKRRCDVEELQNVEQIIDRGIREGVFREDLNSELVNKCIFELIRISANSEIFSPDRYSRHDIIKNVYINYLKGIATEKGREIINSQEKGMQFFK